jgi:azurin
MEYTMKMMIRTLACVSLLAASGGAFADNVCKLEISGSDAMKYDKSELVVGADCTEVEVTLKHSGKLPANAMGHNFVVAKAGDMGAIVGDGMGAGLTNNYIKKDDARVIAHTKVVGGGESTTVKFPTSKLKKGEAYSFFCTFPGHSSMMKGTLKY